MPNFCGCGLEITGPDRAAILDAVKGDLYVDDDGEWTVYFDLDRIVPSPKGMWERSSDDEKSGDEWRAWVTENWGSIVYPDRQGHRESEPNDPEHDFDYIWWTSPWSPPVLALCALSRMFPENSFLLRFGTEPFIVHMINFQAGRAEEKSDKQVQQILEAEPSWARETAAFCEAAASGEFDEVESPELSEAEASMSYEEAERAERNV
jgi:hypothetical protein